MVNLSMAKNKGGRPRAKDQRRDQFFQVRLTAKELETLKKMAEAIVDKYINSR